MDIEKKRSRGWCFTINDYTDNDKQLLQEMVSENSNFKPSYLAYKFEISETEEPFVKGYMIFAVQKTGLRMKKFCPKAQWESVHINEIKVRRGYMENGDYIVYDNLPKPQKRDNSPKLNQDNRIETLFEMISDGKSNREIALFDPSMFLKYRNKINSLRSIILKPRTEKPFVEWVWGKPGSGKTYYAMNLGKSYFMKDSTKWWDGYHGQEVIIIDNFDGKMPCPDFTNILDWVPYLGEIRYSSVNINSPYVVITSLYPPDKIPRGSKPPYLTQRQFDKMIRLVDKITCMNQ